MLRKRFRKLPGPGLVDPDAVPILDKVQERHHIVAILIAGGEVLYGGRVVDGCPVIADQHVVEGTHLDVGGLQHHIHGLLVRGQGHLHAVHVLDGVIGVENVAPGLPGVKAAFPVLKAGEKAVLDVLLEIRSHCGRILHRELCEQLLGLL